jgi:hypothetical protein
MTISVGTFLRLASERVLVRARFLPGPTRKLRTSVISYDEPGGVVLAIDHIEPLIVAGRIAKAKNSPRLHFQSIPLDTDQVHGWLFLNNWDTPHQFALSADAPTGESYRMEGMPLPVLLQLTRVNEYLRTLLDLREIAPRTSCSAHICLGVAEITFRRLSSFLAEEERKIAQAVEALSSLAATR